MSKLSPSAARTHTRGRISSRNTPGPERRSRSRSSARPSGRASRSARARSAARRTAPTRCSDSTVLCTQMLGEQIGDEDEPGEQRQGQQHEARADQPEHDLLQRIERRQHRSADRRCAACAGADPGTPAARPSPPRRTAGRPRPWTAGYARSAPSRARSPRHRCARRRSAAAPTAAAASKMAPRTRFCWSMEIKQASTASVQASSDIASSRPMEKGPLMRMMLHDGVAVRRRWRRRIRAHAMGSKPRIAHAAQHHPGAGGIEQRTE